MAQLFVGLMAEGSTDYRFLKPVIEKTLINLAFECKGQVDVDVFDINCSKAGSFTDYVLRASQQGLEKFGIMVLIIHADADDATAADVYKNKIEPAIAKLTRQDEENFCKKGAALIPIYETESWMLADKPLLKKYIGSKMTDAELGLEGNPESFTHPKERIEAAIAKSREEQPKKLRYKLNIDDMYSILGEAIQLEKLSNFSSFQDFERNFRNALVDLNYLEQ